MKSLLILFFLSFSFLSTYAQAGHDKGNGAYGLSCLSHDNTPMSFLYDVVEANKIYDLTIYAPKGQDTPFLIALAYIEGLKKLDPVRYEKYKKWLYSFEKEAKVLPSMELTDTSDLGAGIIPKQCQLQQLAIQVTPTRSQDPRYLLNGDLLRKMNFLNRAATMLHEVIYRDYLEINSHVSSSTSVRYLNMMLFSNEITKMDPKEYQALIKKLGFYSID